MIKFNNVSKSFESKKIIENLNLEFPKKGVVCLFGESGIGKSTVLNLISGIIKPDSGEIKEIENKNFSYVFQDDRLIEWLNVLENVMIVINRGQTSEKNKIAEDFLNKFELLDFKNKYPQELSGGMRRKLSIARALAFSGDVFLLDEPFKGLDEKSKQKAANIILSNAKNKLVILVSHEENEIKLMKVDKVYRIDKSPINRILIN